MGKKLKDFIIRFFTVNILLKVASLLLSIFLWFLVMNINNPTETKTFSVDLTILNESILEENEILILNKDELTDKKVQIKLKATRQALSELNKKANKDNIVAYLDLDQFKSASISGNTEFLTNVNVTLPTMSYAYEIMAIDPITVSINLDNITTISKKINTKKIGSLSEDYLSSDVELSSDYIQITGASSILNTIENVFVEINVNNADSNISLSAKPIAYDNEGNEVKNISFNPPEIDVEVPIYSKVNISVLEPKLQGEAKNGYIVSSVSYSPKEFSIFVSEDLESTISKDVTPVVDISNLSESTDFTFSVNEFFEDNDIFYETPSKITVTVKVEQEESLDININPSKIKLENLDENYTIKILDEEDLKLSLVGSSTNLSKVDESKITGSVNLENIFAGTHSLKVNFSLPDGVVLKEDVFLNVSITDKENESENNLVE